MTLYLRPDYTLGASGSAALPALFPCGSPDLVIIFDLDGVIYLGETPIPGAIEGLKELEADGHDLAYLTNNSTRSRSDYAARLTRMGKPTRAAEVMTSAYASALYLRDTGAVGQRVFVIGESGLREELREAGLIVIGEDDPAPVSFVVVGLDRELTYAAIRRAFVEITENGAVFIATNRDATYPMERGEIPGGGAIVAPIEYSTGTAAITIGKPEPHTWRRILEQTGCSPAEAVMVGDRPETDIRGARDIGIRTVLVLTGVTSRAGLSAIPAQHRPDHVLDRVADLPHFVRTLRTRP